MIFSTPIVGVLIIYKLFTVPLLFIHSNKI
jgi:hypothetical protein